jgi:hypothetical protein
MSKSYKIKVNQGPGEAKFVDIPQVGASGKPLAVKAEPGGKYQLLDGSTGYAPENIRASRSGKNLQVFFEGRNQPDLVIEDYYEVTPEGFNGLIGESESGRFYEYIPETAAGNSAVPLLADGSNQVGMALGGAEINASGAAVGALVAAAGFNPLLLAPLALLGAGGGGGGGGGTSSGTSASGKLDENPSSDSGRLGDNITSVTKPTVVGKSDAGVSSVEVSFRNPKGELIGPYKATLNADGTYKVTPTDALIDNSLDTKGTQYTPVITVTNSAGVKTTNDGTPFVVDTQAPKLTLKIDADINNDGYISSIDKVQSSDLRVTATFDKSKANVGDEVHFQYSTGKIDVVVLTQAMVNDGKVGYDFKGLIVDNENLPVRSWYFDAAKNQNMDSDSAVVDLVVNAKFSGDTNSSSSIKVTSNEVIAYKLSGNSKWALLQKNNEFTFAAGSDYNLADSAGNLFSSGKGGATFTSYGSINNNLSNAAGLDLLKKDLTQLNPSMYKIAESLTAGIKSVSMTDSSNDTLNIDLLDVLNNGVNDVLKLNLGAEPQFKIDGNQGDVIRLTNDMQGKGGWTNIGAVGENYTHYSGFALGLEVDLLVNKNITVNIV